MQQHDTVPPDGDSPEIPPTSEIIQESKVDEFIETNPTSIVENFEESKGVEFVPIVAIDGENNPNNAEKLEITVKFEDDTENDDKINEEVIKEVGNVDETIDKSVEKAVMDEKVEVLVVKEEVMENLSDVPKNDETLSSGSGGKGKRGAKAKMGTPVKVLSKKGVVEDVCFLCLDGGDLVFCDRRGCSKAYHPSCVGHDADFFNTKGRWNCGWHQCNQCGKNAFFMCYTCQFSSCKSCSKDAAISFVRGNKGFCETCMKTIMVIESSNQSETGHNAFNDPSSWESKFKDYWLQHKEMLGITFDELSQAKKPWKDSDNQQTSIVVHAGDNGGDDPDRFPGNKESSDSKRKKAKRKSKSQAKEDSDSDYSSPDTSNRKGKKAKKLSKSSSKAVKWASKELLEFVMHMKNGDQSVLTQFDVQALLLDYIKINKLRDPRGRSHIICDSMFKKLFRKPRVGHFEMLKLLESHFLLKDDSHAGDNQGIVADAEMSQLNPEDRTDSQLDGGKNKGKKLRKKGSQSNLEDYAAIDMHNINLIFLRRNLLEVLVENSGTFHEKAVGSFVRIKTSGSNQKQDMYRLVQITGTSKAVESYKVGKRTTDFMLEILNLNKTETTSIDIISNQDFSEDECKRLRQSIKCGLINRMTVGDVLEKATALHEVRIADWLESEIMRLSHLRDRASEKGRKKELRVCVEKLQLLKTPEERQRRLDELPEVHADPKMDPSYVSEDEMDTSQAKDTMPSETEITRKGRDYSSLRDSWQKPEPNRNSSGIDFSGRREEKVFTSPTREHSREKPKMISGSSLLAQYGVRSDTYTHTVPEPPRIPTVAVQSDSRLSETEKMWHYRDPAGKVQGPFSITQLRKWESTGYFPPELRIWRISQSDIDFIFLTDVLAGRFNKEVPSVGPTLNIASTIKNVPSSINTSNLLGNPRSSGDGRYDSYNLPSPTPTRSSFPSSNQLVGDIERLPSPTPQSSVQMVNQPFTVPNPVTTQPNLAQIFSNAVHPATVQNPSVYTHGWSSGHAARPETLNPSMIHNSLNVPYGQRAATSLSNQAPSYGASYTRPHMPAQDARRSTSTNMVWAGQQHQMVNQNMTGGRTNPSWVAGPGNTGGRGGDHNRNGGASQWNRRTSFGNG